MIALSTLQTTAETLMAKAAIETACWDIMGKAGGKPVHKLLGGSYTDKVRAYASALMPANADEVKGQPEGNTAADKALAAYLADCLLLVRQLQSKLWSL